MIPFPDTYRDKIKALAASGLDGEAVARKFLEHQAPVDLAYFFIDLGLEGAMLDRWFDCIAPPLPREDRQKITEALDSGKPQALAQAFRQTNLSPKAIKESLFALTRTMKAMNVVDVLLDRDFNAFEIFQSLSGRLNLWKRLGMLNQLLKKNRASDKIWEEYHQSIDYPESSLTDALAIAHALNFSAAGFSNLADKLKLDAEIIASHAPHVLPAKMRDLKHWEAAFGSSLAQVPTENLGKKLILREKSRSRWFQSVGPNVLYCYLGVLNRAVPGTYFISPQPINDPLNPPDDLRKFPDFQLVLYADGGVRAKHFGIDGLRCSAHELYTIGHAYEGVHQNGTITLSEVSDYPADPKRPTLGDLTLTNMAIDPTGKIMQLEWGGKSKKLHWDPGY